jgi:ABC-type transport system substrate-binding protein
MNFGMAIWMRPAFIATWMLSLAQAIDLAWAAGTLRIAITATDVPTTTGAPDNGYEGLRFLGYPVFEGLVLWNLSSADKLAGIAPGLAERWEQDANDKTKWVFHLRKGVKFHDGSDFNADVVVWNLDRYFKQGAPQFDPPGAGVTQGRNPFVAGYRRIDGDTIEITTPRPLSYFPSMLPYMLFSARTVRENRLVGGICQGAVRYGSIQDHRVQAAHQRDSHPQ